jgi:uncharacterized protein YprB with RNaseH-like and TPR domain
VRLGFQDTNANIYVGNRSNLNPKRPREEDHNPGGNPTPARTPNLKVAMQPKILFFDIETAPNLSYVWGHYEQNVIAHEREWYLLCVSYRWGVDGKTKCVALTDYPKTFAANPEDDSRVSTELWDLLNEADIVIGHNGDKFDIRKANAKFLEHGLGPPSPYKTVDTLKAARRYFMFNSNALGQLGTHLGLGGKEETGGFATWQGCMRGDLDAFKKMVKYAKKDTDLLVDVYLAMRPWIKNHPNMGIDSKVHTCPSCGSTDVMKRGFRTTQTMTYQRWSCLTCSSYSRSRQSVPGNRPLLVP